MFKKPTLLLNREICIENIKKIALKAQKSNTTLRPHFKTHQSGEIGSWFRDFGVNSCTVSSFNMAKYFAENNFRDITIAFPVNILEWSEIDELSGKINLNICVESIEILEFMEQKLSNRVGVFIKTDIGYGRTGIDSGDIEKIHSLARLVSNYKHLHFKGILCHAGHTYSAKSKGEIETIFLDSRKKLLKIKEELKGEFPDIIVSYGDTPSCSICNDFSDFDEIRPGNFVFYDEMQVGLGSCTREDIAVALIAPVVAVHENRKELVLHGGAIHLSKEYILDQHGKPYYGVALKFDGENWQCNEVIGKVSRIAQEHGVVALENMDAMEAKPGDRVAILPIHSCLTANLMESYYLNSGKRISMMPKV